MAHILAAGPAIAVGLWMLAGAALRLGLTADFLPKPALVGYANGVAMQIIASQATKLLGQSATASRPGQAAES